MEDEMADFIDFIVKASEKPDLKLLENLKKQLSTVNSTEELAKWFKQNGFYLPMEDVERIFVNRKEMATLESSVKEY